MVRRLRLAGLLDPRACRERDLCMAMIFGRGDRTGVKARDGSCAGWFASESMTQIGVQGG